MALFIGHVGFGLLKLKEYQASQAGRRTKIVASP